MSIQGAIVTTLEADGTVTGICSTRIYPQVAPPTAAFPRITYFVVDQEIDHTYDGASGMYTTNIQIDCRAESYDSARTLSNAVRDALDDLSGTVDSTNIQALSVERLAELYEPPSDGNQLGVHNCSLELIAYHTES